MLDVQNLSMHFGGIKAVTDVSFSVDRGEIVSVIGPNGAGKTTVFNAVTGVYDPTKGRVLFDGHTAEAPLTAGTLARFALAAVATAVLAFLAATGAEGLWFATVKRPILNGEQGFSAGRALADAVAYVRGDFAVQKPLRGSRWRVVSADGSAELAALPNRAEAERVRDAAMRGEATGGADPAKLAAMREAAASHTFTTGIATLAGLALGGAGSFAIWRRNRRSPDGIALAGMARTFQNIRLFQHMTVLENVLVGRDRSMKQNAVAMALRLPNVRRAEREQEGKSLELLDFVGLRPLAGKLAKNLPYGDQRKLEIARALATDPKLLLLDEPAAGMNPSETVSLMGLIGRIRERGVTVVLIEHHMSLVMGISDRIVVLEYGQKIADGKPEQVKNDPRVIEAYLGKEEVS